MTELKIKKVGIVPPNFVKLELSNGDHVIIDPMELFSDVKDAMEDLK